MRSVYFHLTQTSLEEVKAWLEQQFPDQEEPWNFWVSETQQETALYINIDHHKALRMEPEFWDILVMGLGTPEVISLIVDVSGKHPGDEQVRVFSQRLLTRFHGRASDDYTDHLWTLTEILNGTQVQGHPFFDYRGWYEQG